MFRKILLSCCLACVAGALAPAQTIAVATVNEEPYSLRLDLGFGYWAFAQEIASSGAPIQSDAMAVPLTARLAADVLPFLSLEALIEFRAIYKTEGLDGESVLRYMVGPSFDPCLYVSFLNKTEATKARVVLSRTGLGYNTELVNYIEPRLALQSRLGVTLATRTGTSAASWSSAQLLSNLNFGLRYQALRDAEILVGLETKKRRDRFLAELDYWPNVGLTTAEVPLSPLEAARIGARLEWYTQQFTLGLIGSTMPFREGYSFYEGGFYLAFPLGWRAF